MSSSMLRTVCLGCVVVSSAIAIACSSDSSGSATISDGGASDGGASDGSSGDTGATDGGSDVATNDAPHDSASEAATDGGCSGGTALPVGGWQFRGNSGTMSFYLSYGVASTPPNYQLAGRDTTTDSGGTSFGVGVQFLAKPTAEGTYTVQDYGVVTDPNKAFVYVSETYTGGYTNYNGIAGGCVDVTIVNGKVVAAFNGLMVAHGDAGALPVTATIREQ